MIRSDVLLTGRMRWRDTRSIPGGRPPSDSTSRFVRVPLFPGSPRFFATMPTVWSAGPPKGYHITVVTLSLSSWRT